MYFFHCFFSEFASRLSDTPFVGGFCVLGTIRRKGVSTIKLYG